MSKKELVNNKFLQKLFDDAETKYEVPNPSKDVMVDITQEIFEELDKTVAIDGSVSDYLEEKQNLGVDFEDYGWYQNEENPYASDFQNDYEYMYGYRSGEEIIVPSEPSLLLEHYSEWSGFDVESGGVGMSHCVASNSYLPDLTDFFTNNYSLVPSVESGGYTVGELIVELPETVILDLHKTIDTIIDLLDNGHEDFAITEFFNKFDLDIEEFSSFTSTDISCIYDELSDLSDVFSVYLFNIKHTTGSFIYSYDDNEWNNDNETVLVSSSRA